MREIKFRGNTNSGNWFYGDLWQSGGKSFIVHPDYPTYEVNIESVGQYTGLLDINGKEVYEGDVVKWADWEKVEQITPLEWDVVMCRFVCRYKNGYWRMFGSEFSVEIVGNIYENPEMAVMDS